MKFLKLGVTYCSSLLWEKTQNSIYAGITIKKQSNSKEIVKKHCTFFLRVQNEVITTSKSQLILNKTFYG